jgi:hypothetical protein
VSTYDLWKASVQLAEDATSEAEREHHHAVAGALKAGAIKDYFGHIAGELYDPTEEIVDTPDDKQVSEFFRDLDALRAPARPELDKLTDQALTKALDALKAMESLNYTGEHTHFEVLADVRQVLAAVMLGKPMPQLERFRCPSQKQVNKHVKVQCQLQLPHEEHHCYVRGDGTRVAWNDVESANPPKSYDEPAAAVGLKQDGFRINRKEKCGATGNFGDGAAAICERYEGHQDVHCAVDGREWI